MKRIILGVLAFILTASFSYAQTPVLPYVRFANGGSDAVSAANPFPLGLYDPASGALIDPTLPQQVVGNVAGGAVDSGNPIKGGAVSLTTPPTYANGQRTDNQADTRGSLFVAIRGTNGTVSPSVAGPAANQSGQNALYVLSYPMLFNGTSYTRGVGIGGSDGTGNGVAAVALDGDTFSHLSANGTTTIKSGAGTLHNVTINTAGATDTITLYDNTVGSGNVIAVIGSSAQTTLSYNLRFSIGLTAVVAGTTAADATVTYR